MKPTVHSRVPNFRLRTIFAWITLSVPILGYPHSGLQGLGIFEAMAYFLPFFLLAGLIATNGKWR